MYFNTIESNLHVLHSSTILQLLSMNIDQQSNAINLHEDVATIWRSINYA